MKKILKISVVLILILIVVWYFRDLKNYTKEVAENFNPKEKIFGNVNVSGIKISKTNINNIDIISFTNIERAKIGLHPLVENTKLNESAVKKVDDMFKYQYFEHKSPSGVGVSDLGTSVGYEYISIGENLASGDFTNAQSVVDAWMASPGHKANILNRNYIDIGVYAKQGEFQGKKIWLIVQHFGTPKTECPEVEMGLKVVIDDTQSTLSKMQKKLAKDLNNINNDIEVAGKSIDQQIEEYNAYVKKYNALSVELKKQIEKYNLEVKAFNACVESKQ